MNIPSVQELIGYCVAYGPWLITAASVVRGVLVKGEDLLEIWVSKTAESRVWKLYEKIEKSLEFVSISTNRPDSKRLGNWVKDTGELPK